MTEQSMTTSEVLNRAADLLENHGWQVGDWGIDSNGDPSGAMCIEGAITAACAPIDRVWFEGHDGISRVCETTADKCPAGLAVHRYLNTEVGHMWQWNDAEDRTAAEVIEVLRATALIEAARDTPTPTSALTTEAGL